jgi:hypothetical protein
MLDSDERDFVMQRVFIPLDENAIFDPPTSAEQLVQNGLAAVAATFHRNVQAVLSTATVPFRLTVASVQHLRWQQLVTSERIRARTLIHAGTPEDEAVRIAISVAKERMATELQSEADAFSDRVLSNLMDALHDSKFAEGAVELLRQSTVLTWSAFEVLSQETFVELLNMRPSLTLRLSADESARRHFPLKSVAMETLVEHGFDLSHHMGDLVARLRAVDSVPVMRSAFSALLPAAHDLHVALADRSLWTLNQRRHLIVHKRGVIDREYLAKTDEDLETGQQLAITSFDLEAYLRAVVGVGSELLRAAAGV